MTIHTDEEEIKGNVQRCPYFRPQSIILDYTPQNVEGFMENFDTEDWKNFLDSIDGEDKKKAAVAAAVAGGQVWLDHLVAVANGHHPTSILKTTKLGPFSKEFLMLMQRQKTETADGQRVLDAAIAVCYEWNRFVHFLGDYAVDPTAAVGAARGS